MRFKPPYRSEGGPIRPQSTHIHAGEAGYGKIGQEPQAGQCDEMYVSLPPDRAFHPELALPDAEIETLTRVDKVGIAPDDGFIGLVEPGPPPVGLLGLPLTRVI